MPGTNLLTCRSRHKLGAALALCATLLLPAAARAEIVLPGQQVTLAGTTDAKRPETGGLVLADVDRAFSISDGHHGAVQGYLQDRVVRSSVTGTLIFYQRIVLNADSSAITSLNAFVRSNFTAVTSDVDYRTDGQGDLGSSSALYSKTGTSIRFNLDREIAPGESTYFHMILTNATGYAASGTTTLIGPDLARTTLATFQPSGNPQPYYTATTLGNLSDIHINNRGQLSMVDYATSLPELWNPALPNSTDGEVYSLPLPSGFLYTDVAHINSDGWIAGTAYTQAQPDLHSRAYLWKPTSSNATTYNTTPLALYPGDTYSIGLGINDAGEIVGGGGSTSSNGTSRLWSKGSVFPVTNTDYGNAYAINNGGEIAAYGDFGYGTYQGCLWTPSSPDGATGTLSYVYTDGGTEYTGSGVTYALNDSGVAVGYAEYDGEAGFASYGYIWDGDTVTDLGVNAIPSAINAAGTVVGSVDYGEGFLYRNGAMTSLSYFISPKTDTVIYTADDINTTEQIVGYGRQAGLGTTYLLLTPVRISAMSPSTATHGSAAVTLTIKGLGFLTGAKLLWNATTLDVTRINSNQLQVTVPSSLLSSPGTPRLQVINPDGTYSSTRNFTVQ